MLTFQLPESKNPLLYTCLLIHDYIYCNSYDLLAQPRDSAGVLYGGKSTEGSRSTLSASNVPS